MKLNETRLEVAKALAEKLDTLHSAAFIESGSLKCCNMTFEQVERNPVEAAIRIKRMNNLYKLMISEFSECCDLANDLVYSLESGKKCGVLPTEPTEKGA